MNEIEKLKLLMQNDEKLRKFNEDIENMKLLFKVQFNREYTLEDIYDLLKLFYKSKKIK